MKIGSAYGLPPAGADVTPAAGARAGGVKAAPAGSTGGQVDVSSAATAMNGLDGSGEFDAAKVDAIRSAIRNGSFQVNPGAIADRIISEARSLVGSQAH